MTQEVIDALSEKYTKVFGQTPEYLKAEQVFNCVTEISGNDTVLIDAVTAETDLAFQYGFYAAVELLTGGVNFK